MPMFGLRYDLRCPSFGPASAADIYAAALDQCQWADELGFVSVTISEHHGQDDGYLPSPLVFGAAVAARTKHVRLVFAALITPLHDPIRIAEDIAVLDLISGGRVVPVVAGGYDPNEFAMFDKAYGSRRTAMEEIIPFLEQAWTGEPFEWHGRTVRVTPRPVQQPRPPILMGGAAEPAARRAARYADGFIPSVPEAFEIYRDELRTLGKPDPGPYSLGAALFTHVAKDPDAAWKAIAPHAMHEMNAYGRMNQAAAERTAGTQSPYSPIDDPDALRATGMYSIITPEECVALCERLGPTGTLNFHPMMGGIPPELAWEGLRLFEREVLPKVR